MAESMIATEKARAKAVAAVAADFVFIGFNWQGSLTEGKGEV